MGENQKSSTEEIREARTRLVETDIDRFYGVTVDLLKWGVAGTLTLNGAPLLVMLGSEKLRPELMGPGILLVFGVVTSVFGNMLLIRGFTEAGNALLNAHWNGNSTRHDDYSDVAPESHSNRASRHSSILLSISLLCFMFGMFWLAAGVRETVNSDVRAQATTAKLSSGASTTSPDQHSQSPLQSVKGSER